MNGRNNLSYRSGYSSISNVSGLNTESSYLASRENQLSDLIKQNYRETSDYRRKLADAYYNEEERKINNIRDIIIKNEKKYYKTKLEYEKKLNALSKKTSSEEEKAELKRLENKYKKEKEFYQKLIEYQVKQEKDKERQLQRQEYKDLLKLSSSELSKYGLTRAEVKSHLKDISTSEDFKKDIKELTHSIVGNASKLLDSSITEISKYTSRWNTRLQGSGLFRNYYSLTNTIDKVVGFSPFVTLQSVYSNIDNLIEKGINYNLEQRAFLQSIKDDIASTFDVANGTLLQLVRIQQSDTTAARLGMESYLTKFLNGMYSNTEYLSDVFDNVSSSLYETTSLLTDKMGVEFEYTVQKWLGSMYSLGMSSQSLTSIANALGQLGSGNFTGMNEQMQTLMVMSASKAGLNLGEVMKSGLNASTTNLLMQSLVSYLGEVGSGNNNILRSQFANLFGLTASDLKALSTLAKSSSKVSGSQLSYSQSLGNLNLMANTMMLRKSSGELLNNVWNNTLFNIASGIASNPVSLALWKGSNLLSDIMGGISIPSVGAMGNFVDLETNVADLMKVGALSGGILSSMGSLIGSLFTSSGGLNVASMISSLGVVSGASRVLSRGVSNALGMAGTSTSGSTYVGNTSGSDIYQQSMMSAEEQKLELKSDENKNVNDIYNLLTGNDSNKLEMVNVIIKGIDTPEVLNVNIESMDDNVAFALGGLRR